MTEKLENNTNETKGKAAPKLVATPKGTFRWEGKGWYRRCWVRVDSLDESDPTPPRYFKELPSK